MKVRLGHPPKAAATPPARTRWLSLLASAAVIVTTAVVVSLAITSLRGEAGGSPTAPTSSATSPPPSADITLGPSQAPETTAPAGSLAIAWSDATVPGRPLRVTIATDGGWAALSDGAAWWSPDGIDWQPGTFDPVSVPPPQDSADLWSTPRPTAIARFRDALFVIAHWEGPSGGYVPVVFKSVDGRHWSHLPSSDWWGQASTGLASDGSRLIAANHNFGVGTGAVFSSPDGVTWSEHFAPGGPASMLDVVADSDRSVAVGYRLSDSELQVPVVWWSEDGEAWSESELPGAAERTIPWSIGRAGDGTYALLTTTTRQFTPPCPDDGCPPADIAVWYSRDAKEWHRGELPAASVADARDLNSWMLSPAAGGLVAGGITEDGPMIWASLDGVRWSTIGLPPSVNAEFSLAAGAGDAMLLFLSGNAGDHALGGIISQEP